MQRESGIIPDLFPFYGRDDELTQLNDWIVRENCRLIAISGTIGIGKTALIRQLLERVKAKFDRVIWLNISEHKSCVEFIARDLLSALSLNQIVDLNLDVQTSILLAIEHLQKQRCLIVMDDYHRVFRDRQLAGTYSEGFEDYGLLLKRIHESNHQSCVLLLSWDKPREIDLLEGKNKLVRALQLNSLGESAKEIGSLLLRVIS